MASNSPAALTKPAGVMLQLFSIPLGFIGIFMTLGNLFDPHCGMGGMIGVCALFGAYKMLRAGGKPARRSS